MAVGDIAMITESQKAQLETAWQSISSMKPQLREHVNIYQQNYRGQDWIILTDEFKESYFRCSQTAYRFLTLLDGARTVEEAYHELQNQQPTQIDRADILMLLTNLLTADLLYSDHKIEIDELVQRFEANNQHLHRQKWSRPFAIKIPLLDPDHFLEKTKNIIAPFLHRLTLWIWGIVVLIAISTAWLNWSDLQEHWQSRFTDPVNLLWLWLMYPVIKAIHELGHAYTTKIWGGVVHEMGVMFLVFFPVPYVDSSASNRFQSKHRRMIVGAVGILVELFLAAIALLIWVNISPGLLSDILFNIMVIGGISTLLFNGNPLLRFDAYYVLSDAIEIPNLATRSNQYLGYLFKRNILSIQTGRSPITAPGEARWFVIYGLASGVYRIWISFFIAFWVAGKFFIVGTLLALWALFSQIIQPLWKSVSRLLPQVIKAEKTFRFSVVMTLSIIFCSLIMLTPIHNSTKADGMISLPENAFIRTATDGIVLHLLVENGQIVDANSALVQLENISLDSELAILQARLAETKARHQQVMLEDRLQSGILSDTISNIESDIGAIKQQLAGLTVKSTGQGVVSLFGHSDLPGRYLAKGDAIGYVADLRQLNAMVVVPQSAIEAVLNNTSTVDVKLRSNPADTIEAQLVGAIPLAGNKLPSMVLGSQSGGSIAVDTRDEKGLLTMSNFFQVEIALPVRAEGEYIGQQISVRFIHDKSSLGHRLLRYLHRKALESPLLFIFS